MRRRPTLRFAPLLTLLVGALTIGSLFLGTIALAAGNPLPVATVNNASGLIGEPVTLTVTFDNASTGTGDQTGYGPYIDLFLDTTGPDGAIALPFDGLETPGMRATYLGQPLPGLDFITITGPTYVHPLTGQTLSVPGYGTRFQNGDTIAILTLPFGSFTNTQPPAPIDVTLRISNLADLGMPLPVTAIAGFRYGADPLDNPGADPPIRQTPPSDADVTPILWRLTKTYLGPEDETATGRNYPRRYRLDVDIADGQPVTGLQITDTLANSMRITGNTAAQMSARLYNTPGVPTEVFNPANLSGTATPAAPGGTLVYTFGDKTGVRGVDASFEFEFYIPRDTSAATPTVPQGTDSTLANNTGSSSATWTPIDTRDASTPITITLPPNAHTLQQHSLATQKSVTPVDRTTLAPTSGSIIPGQTLLRYDIDFQVSDYFAVQNVYLEDILSDGQRLFVRTTGNSTMPTLQVENAYVTGASPSRVTIPAAPFSGTGTITYEQRFTTRSTLLSDPTSPPSGPVFVINTPAPSSSGTTYVRFNISQELIARGVSGRLVGGDIPNAGGAPQNNNPPLFGPTQGRITFYAEVKDEFSDDFPSGDRSVDQLDILRNNVPLIRGDQIDTTTINNPTPTVIGQATDDTAASVELPIGDRSKTLYALNGQTTDLGDPVTVQPGDLVTYRLTYRLPISSFENVQFIDFPPLPVFPVPDRLFFDAAAAPGTIPGANMVTRGPSDSYLTTINPPTTVRVATTANISSYNPAGIGSFSGAPTTIDGVALANGDRVLVKDQTDARQNGVYVVVNAATGAWDRAADFDTARELTNGPLVGVTAGATNANQHFRQSNQNFNTFNTDPITWAPFITTDAAGNSFALNFGWYDDVDGGRRSSLIDVLVTLRVADAAFANDLFLTNQLRVNEFSTNAGSQYFDEIVMFEVIRPNVTINKGIVGYNASGLTLGGVTFNPPDGPTTFTGAPVYTNTQALAIGASDSLVLTDAGDRVRYAIVLQNEARGDAYDATVTDTIPSAYVLPATLADANFTVRRGDGTLLTGDVVSGTVRVATTALLTGATFTTTPNNGQFTNAPRNIDGVTLNVGDRVLVKDQTSATQNGVYVVTAVFPGVNQATLTRADDFDNDAELTSGYRVAVLGGLSSNANRAFSTAGPITLNTTPVTWSDAGISDYYATYNPSTGAFSVVLADDYTAGNTTAPTRDDRRGGLSRGASGPSSNIVGVTNGSNTIIITYDVTLGNNVEPNQQIINTATLTNVATSDGGIDDLPDPFDTALVTIRRPGIAKVLTATEIENSANTRQQAVIGELVTYTLTLTVPEGVMSNAALTDTLDAGLAFVDVTGVTASPSLSFAGGGLPTVGATPANTTIGAGGQTLVFNFGTITNSDRNNAADETIAITYRAVVLNTVANQSGAQRNNRADFSWDVPGQGSYALLPVEAENVTIIEPTLAVGKTLPPGIYDTGDTIDYTITISHTAGSQTDAYDAVITDTLPIDPFGSGSLILTPAVLSVTDSAGLLTIADFTLTGSDATSWTLSNSTPIDAAQGRTISIVVRGTLSNAAMPGATITNTAFLRWTSLDGDPGQRSTHAADSTERTGADGPGGALNDYAVTGSATFVIPTVTPGKALVATSEAHTSDSNVTIGEIVRFRIAIGGPEASVYAFSLVDRLPPGLTFLNDGSARFAFIANSNITTAGVYDVAPVSCPAINPTGVTTLADVLNPTILPSSSINCTFGDSNISSNETTNQDVYGSGTDVFFRFGNLSNNDNDAGEEFIVVEFNAIVDNDTTDPNDAGDVRNNTVVARMNPPGFGAFETAPSAPVSVTVVEPNIAFNAATNNKTATPTGGDAFDFITYTVTFTNATGATVSDAFDVRILDTLPVTDVTLIPASISVSSAGGCATGVTNASASNTVDVTIGRVPPGCNVTITYQGTLNVSVVPGQTITNTANLTYTSLPGNTGTGGFFGSTAGASGSATGERNGSGGINDYAGSDTATVAIVAPALAKRIVATSEAHTADPLVLADFTNTGFDGFLGGTNTWNTPGNVITSSTFIRISGSATEQGSGFIAFATPVDLSNHATLALSARLVAGNGANNIDIHLQDADGTNWRWRFPASNFNTSTFTLVPQNLLGPNSTTIAAGTTPGLDLRNIVRLEIRGAGGTAQFDIDIDAVIAFGNIAAPGEIVRYRLVTTIPEGTSPNLQLLDRIPTGMRFINDNTARVAFVSTNGITSTSAGAQVPALSGTGLNITGNQDSVVGLSLAVGSGNGLAIGEGTAFDGNVSSSNDVLTDTDTYNNGSDVFFRLGNVVNNDNDDDLEFIVIEFNAQVLNVFNVGNQSGVGLNNDFQYFRNGAQVGSTSAQNGINRITVVEPQINNLSKTLAGAPPVDAGDVFTYTLRFANGVAWPTRPAVPVRVATTGNITGFNATGGFGGTGQFANAPATVDGVTLNVGDRILVRSQTNAAENGIYTLVFIDPFTDARVWDRATDMDDTAELALGYRVFVQEGATLAGRTYYLDEPVPTLINAGALNWREVAPAMTVAVATTGSLGGASFNPSGGILGRGTLTTTATTIDGIPVNATNFPVGTRILVKNQSTAANGVYQVTGFTSPTLTLERVPEFDSHLEAVIGAQVYVTGGTINAGRTFAVQTAPSGTPITTTTNFEIVDQVAAFDVTVFDQLPPTLELLGVQIDAPTGTTATNGSTLGIGGVISYTLDRLDSVQDITTGRNDVVITATVRVVTGTVASAQITNTARVQYTSLPDARGTLGNPTGSNVDAGTAGTQNGERTGQGVLDPTNNTPPSNNGIRNNYSVGAIALNHLAAPMFDKQFQGGSISDDDSSVPGTSGASVAVGEAVLYDLRVTLPEGTTNNLRVVDAVPDGMRFDTSFNGGLGYQIVTTAGGSLAENFSDPAAVASPTLSVSGTGTLGQDGVDALFSFGNVTVADDNNPNNNAFIIRVRLIATNTAANQSGASRDNGGALRYTNGYSGGDNELRDPTEPRVTIIEPTPSILKSVSGAAADAGDPITYTLRIENIAPRSEMDAYDVVISDTIAPELINPTIVAVNVTGAPDVSAADFEIATVGPDRILRTTAPITLPLGATVTITFTGDLTSTVTTDQIITNRASMFWSSTPGTNPDERAGADVPNPPECSSLPGDCNLDSTQLNNYGLISSVTTTAIAPVVVSKSVVEGIAPSTPGTDVTIGEIVTYRLAVSLPEGVTSGLVITDTAPSGMAYLPGSATLITGTLATGDPPLAGGHPTDAGSLAFNGVFSDTTDPSVTAIGSGQFLNGTDIRFEFDQITLPGDNDARNNTFFIRYQVVVLDVAGNTGFSGSQTTLTNSGQFDVPSTPQPPTDLLIDPNGATVTVVEPELAIAKSVTPSSGDAGDTVTYTITLSHTARSLADAFDVAISDALPAAIGSSLASPITITNVNATHSVDGDITGNFGVAGNMLTTTTPFTLPRGATVTLTITGVLRQSVQPGEVITNTAALTSTTLPGPNQDLSPDATGVSDGTDRERSRSSSSSATHSVGQGAFSKAILSTSATHTSGTDVTIGEVISYTLIVDLPEGTIRDLTLTDDLPAGLDYEGVTVITDAAQSGGLLTQDFDGIVPSITVSGGAGSGDDVNFTFTGDVVVTGDNNAANNRFLVVARVRALNEPGMVGLIPPGQTVLTNTATMRYTDGSNITRAFTDTETVRVVEPQLTITKDIVQMVANAGDPITITLTVTNTGAADAFDVIITDTLPPEFDAATTTFGTAGSDYPATFTPSRTGSEVRYAGGPIPVGATMTFTFRVNLTGSVTPGTTITNTARMAQSTSLPGDDPTERVQTPVESSDTLTIRSNSLSGFVYVDSDNDGVFDTGENGIGSVTITLSGTDHLGNSVLLTTTTTITGFYRFDNLYPGVYTLLETQPSGYLDGTDAIGTQGGATGNDVLSTIVLPVDTSTNGENNNFGEIPAAQIAGFVYEDDDNDGVFDTGENGIGGVTVTLTGTDDLGSGVLLTTTTTITGFYTFDNLRPGTYTVSETQPSGYLDGRDTAGTLGGDTTVNDRIAGIMLPPGAASLDNNFGELRPASLSGLVYRDDNNNGSLDGSEPGISGVTITLTGTDDLGNPVTLTTTTTITGFYTFDNLRPGTYTVSETQPAGYFDGAETVGTAGGSILSNDVIGNVTLNAGVAATGYDFGEVPAARIAGFVYKDDDNDGVFDTGENGISGVTITLTGTDDLGNPLSLTTTTTITGFYAFDNLRPGTYTVSETQPSGYLDGRDTAGTLGGDTTINDRIAGITLPPGGASLNNNFGELRPASLSGLVYRDDNDNGVPDAGEPGIGGVTVILTGTDDLGNPVTLTTTTTITGFYTFDNLRPGTYTVSETQPAAYNDGRDRVGTAGGDLSNDQVSTIVLGAGVDAANYDFGELGTFVSGVVWIDTDRDGTLDGGESGRLGGVTITLRDSLGNVVSTTTTLADGSYRFDNLPAGNYTIEQTQPTGYGSSTPNTLSVTVPLTGLTDQNFGETVSTLSGFVYVDSDNDGVFDTGESGIGGVTVTLLDSLGNVVSTTLTLADGSYRFENLLAGTYTISETQPLIYSDGQDSVGTIGGVPVGTLVSNDVIGDIDLPAGTDGITYNFGELADAGLGDRVWLDRNGDGAQDVGEPGIGGVTVYLDLNNNGSLDAGEPTATTDADGLYFFGGLAGGTYTVRVDATTLPAGVSQTYDLDGATATPHTAIASLAAGATRTDVDFGYQGSASIGDRVWLDRNGDGVQDAGEPGLSGVVVYLDLNNNGARDPNEPFDATDASGNYLIDGLHAGTYTVRIDASTLPGGIDATYDLDGIGTPGMVTGVTLSDGQARTDVDFGYQGSASIGDRVWNDADANGIQDGGETGVSGIVVALYDSTGTLLITTTTDLNGNYLFDNLPAGTYTVGIGATPGRSISPRGAGSDPALDSDVDRTTRRSNLITLSTGEARRDLDIGLYQLASVGSLVWLDRDLDGIHEANEPGIGSIEVRLLRSDGTLVATRTTDANGYYMFTDVEPGEYRIAFSVPPGYYVSPPHRGSDRGNDSDADPATGQTPIFTLTPGQIDPTWYLGLSPISPTAIQLTRFSVERDANGIVIRWETAAEYGTRGFHIERSASGSRSDAVRITDRLIPARGSVGSGAAYVWSDTTAAPGVRYTYWLVEETTDGSTHIYGPATSEATTGGTHTVVLPLIIR
ncbi:SdrD B-like domain-containing protein [Roseiflexus castenholzii]|uniref:SdrD B-like domain-containing protein n=1 Tax=Roseiflexus castenholzii TaxID=120962 RepID=UPI003C798A40